MVKSFQQNKTADWASVGLLLPLPNPWVLVALAAIPFKSVKFQSMFWWQHRNVPRGSQLSRQMGRVVHDQAQKLLQVDLQTLSFLWQRPQPVTAALKWSAFEEWISGRETDRKAIRELVWAVTEFYILWKQWQGMMAQTSATNANKKQWPWCTCSSFISLENLHTNLFIYKLYIYIYTAMVSFSKCDCVY